MDAKTFTKMVAENFNELKKANPEERETRLRARATELAEAQVRLPQAEKADAKKLPTGV